MQDDYVKRKLQMVRGKHVHTERPGLVPPPRSRERGAPAVNHKLLIPSRIREQLSEKVLPTRVCNHFLHVSTVNKNITVVG